MGGFHLYDDSCGEKAVYLPESFPLSDGVYIDPCIGAMYDDPLYASSNCMCSGTCDGCVFGDERRRRKVTVMVFSSTLFVFLFLPITLLGYYVIKKEYRNYWLLLVSLLFFSWSQPEYLWILILNIAVNYCAAILIDDLKTLRKPVLFAMIGVNLGILYYFKYFDFTIDTINHLSGRFFALKNIALPIGISFFTFQGMSYVIDVYRKDVPVQRNPFKVALYITLFPQLIAGPIVRYKDVAQEMDCRVHSIEDFSDGVQYFIIGMAKKVIIANTMAAVVDDVWAYGPGCNDWAVAWSASIAYTLQIYYDFSGYSDMAIGLGRMFGFHFSENFNLPYISESITEFWRRWHISLSSWFRDYVYIPLGGNQRHVYINLAVVFLLTGIWHGASWHFLVWGVWNGILILTERYIRLKKAESGVEMKKKSAVKRWFGKLYTLLAVNFGWVLFRAPDTQGAVEFIRSMFGMADTSHTGFTLFWYLDRWTLFVLITGIFFSTSIPAGIGQAFNKKVNKRPGMIIQYGALLLLFYFCMLRIVSGTYNPFIYFQF